MLKRKKAPGVGLLQHGTLQAHNISLPAEGAAEGLPLQTAEARPRHRHHRAAQPRLQIQRQRRLLDLGLQTGQEVLMCRMLYTTSMMRNVTMG